MSHSHPIIDTKPFEITTFTKPLGLFFEHKSDAPVASSHWNLIAVVDLRKFQCMLENLEQRLNNICLACKKRFDKDDHCHELIDSVESKMFEIRDRFELITSNQSRNKRAVLDFIGNVAEDIKKLLMNDKNLMHLLKNQTSIVEKTVNILRVNEAELNRQNEWFANFSKRIDKTMDEYAAASFFSDGVAHILQQISEFDAQMDILLGAIFDGRRHHINHNLMPPKQLAV